MCFHLNVSKDDGPDTHEIVFETQRKVCGLWETNVYLNQDKEVSWPSGHQAQVVRSQMCGNFR